MGRNVREGDINLNFQGRNMVLQHYHSPSDVWVVFQGGGRAHTNWYNFYTGNATPQYSLVGKRVSDKDGRTATIVEENDRYFTIKYDKKFKNPMLFGHEGDIVANITANELFNEDFDPEDLLFAPDSPCSIDEIRELTYRNIFYLLNKYRKCAVIRDPGFGKTFMGIRLFEAYNKSLFLHDKKDDINAGRLKGNDKVKVMTYNRLINLSDEEIKDLDYDFVFFDEVHLLGGDPDSKCKGDRGAIKRYTAAKKLMETHPETHFLGATATPNRMDGIDVIESLLGGHVCFPYTMVDAIDDGLVTPPHCYYCLYGLDRILEAQLGEETVKVGRTHHKFSRQELIKKFDNLTLEQLREYDVEYMDENIKRACDKVLPDTRYMRFIAFYLNNEAIKKNKFKVVNWFKKAYPGHQVNCMVVTARTDKNLRDVDALPTEPDEGYEGRIDIIFNCRMLVGGYHSENITGLILDRETDSETLYLQSIGRIFNYDNKNPSIIFDVVDNVHKTFVCKKRIKHDKKVEAKFDCLDTYESIIKANPGGRDWAAIKSLAPELYTYNETPTVDEYALVCGEEVQPKNKKKKHRKPAQKFEKDIVEVQKKAMEEAGKRGLCGQQYLEYVSHKVELAEKWNSRSDTTKRPANPYGGTKKTETGNILPPRKETYEYAMEVHKNRMKQYFAQGWQTTLLYYDSDNSEKYASCFTYENSETDLEEILRKAKERNKIIYMKEIYKEFMKHPRVKVKGPFKSLEDVDKSSNTLDLRWFVLTQLCEACFPHYNVSADDMVKYMITGA